MASRATKKSRFRQFVIAETPQKPAVIVIPEFDPAKRVEGSTEPPLDAAISGDGDVSLLRTVELYEGVETEKMTVRFVRK